MEGKIEIRAGSSRDLVAVLQIASSLDDWFNKDKIRYIDNIWKKSFTNQTDILLWKPKNYLKIKKKSGMFKTLFYGLWPIFFMYILEWGYLVWTADPDLLSKLHFINMPGFI